ncbi:MAG: hypothetical protein ACRCYU_22230 [Nocardioides sp.]
MTAGQSEPSEMEQKVYRELLTARKSPEGLSPVSMALYPTMRDLLGDGDPLTAFQRLSHRVLETLDVGDDVLAIEAASFSLGLGSNAKTHLDRLNEFGETWGYEARQSRRYSDKGIRQLARLITSNWIVHTVPTLEVFLVPQSNGSLLISLTTTRLYFVDMDDIAAYEQVGDGERATVETQLSDARARTDEDAESPETTPLARKVKQTLDKPFVLKAPEPDRPRHLRFEWKGEVWPRFVVNFVNIAASGCVVTSQTLGNTLQVTVERMVSA